VTERSAVTRLPWRIGEITSTRDETPRARTLVLNVEGWPGHLAGQHVDVRLTAADGYQAQRSYSIASAPQNPKLELLIERIANGEVSPYLTGVARPGDRVELRGPIGGYFVWSAPEGGPLLLIGAGSGIAPLASMLAHRAEAAAGLPTRLLYSARSAEDIIFQEQLHAWAGKDPALAVSLTLTRAVPSGWNGYTRRIDLDMLREVAFPATRAPLAYVCGPTSMVEKAADSLVTLGYPAARVRTERFGPSGELS
jgi:ferredoxin-NADP reductase